MWEFKDVGQDIDKPIDDVWDDVDNPAKNVVLEAVIPDESWPIRDVQQVGGDWVDTVSVQEQSDYSWEPHREWPELPEEFDVVSVLFGALNVCEHCIFLLI